MRGALIAALAVAVVVTVERAAPEAHGGRNAITWNREVSRIIYEKCASCHRPAGTAFSLMTYIDAQPRATEIKAAVLSRRMPPWGAVKGFGQFRNDQSLSQEQIEMITQWVDGGIRRGNSPGMLPKPPDFSRQAPETMGSSANGSGAVRVSGTASLDRAMRLAGLIPERLGAASSMQVVAILPSGRSEPLVWLHGYDPRHPHPFLFRNQIPLPAGTVIRGVPADATIALLPG